MAYIGKFIDRSPSLRAAGVLSLQKEEDVAACMVHEVNADEGRPFVCKGGPLEYNLPPKKTNIYKGFFSDVQQCVQPEVNQGFYDVLAEEFKGTVYESYWKKPLGRVADALPMLPEGMDPKNVCFGKVNTKDVTAGELINPPKSFIDVLEASIIGHDMYKLTHNDYNPGEKVDRNYRQPYRSDLIWGINTPCDPQGGCMRKVIRHEDDGKILVSKILADHHKQNKPLVGKVLAPNNNIERVPEDHAFGRLNRRDIYGAGELLKDSAPSMDKMDLYDQMSHINVLRNQISKRQRVFPHRDLVDAFHRLDVNSSGCLCLDDVYKIIADFQIFPEKPLFEEFLTRMKILTEERFVVYEKMADLLNVNVVFPDVDKLEDVPNEFLYFETTNQLAHKYHCSDEVDTRTIRAAGTPPRPYVSLAGLVSPNIFTNYGLQPRDFFTARSPEYLRSLIARMGCELDNQTFNAVWNLAKDDNGCVCVQAFLDALKACK